MRGFYPVSEFFSVVGQSVCFYECFGFFGGGWQIANGRPKAIAGQKQDFDCLPCVQIACFGCAKSPAHQLHGTFALWAHMWIFDELGARLLARQLEALPCGLLLLQSQILELECLPAFEARMLNSITVFFLLHAKFEAQSYLITQCSPSGVSPQTSPSQCKWPRGLCCHVRRRSLLWAGCG